MNRKRLRCLFLALAMLFSMAVPASAASGSLSNFKKQVEYSGFSDVPSNAWYAEGVKTVCEYGIMNGKSDTIFEPSGTVTLVEALTIACRLHNIYHGKSGKFEASSPWYQVYVDYAAENDILSFLEEPDSAFWNGKISNEIFAHLMANALPKNAYSSINKIGIGLLPSISPQTTYVEQIYTLINAGILTGTDSSGTFDAGANITRAEASTIISRIIIPSSRVKSSVTHDNILAWAPTAFIAGSGNLRATLGCTFKVQIYINSTPHSNPISWSSNDITTAYVSEICHDKYTPDNCWTATVVAAGVGETTLFFTDKSNNATSWSIEIVEPETYSMEGVLPALDKTTYKKTPAQLETEAFWEELNRRLANVKADDSTASPAPPTTATTATTNTPAVPTCNYIINTNTGKFHYPSCSSVKQMNESNKWYYTGTRDDVIDMGYVPCKRCYP